MLHARGQTEDDMVGSFGSNIILLEQPVEHQSSSSRCATGRKLLLVGVLHMPASRLDFAYLSFL